MDDDSWIWILGIGVAGFILYQKGWGAWFGKCPSGYVLTQDMFPGCVESRVAALWDIPIQVSHTDTMPDLTPPQAYGWDGSKVIVVPRGYL